MCFFSPNVKSQIRPDSSSEPNTMRVPSVEIATDLTSRECPFNTQTISPVVAFYIRTELSDEPDATSDPSAENATEVTWHE